MTSCAYAIETQENKPSPGVRVIARFIFAVSAQNNPSDGVYASDGTAAGTVGIGEYQGGIYPSGIFGVGPEFDGKSFYLEGDYAGNGAYTTNLVSTDGTKAGTKALLSLNTSENTLPTGIWDLGSTLVAAGVLAGADTGSPTAGLWASTDGTTFNPIATGITAANITEANGVGYFAGVQSNGSSAGLWRTDGTVAGTYNIAPPSLVADPVNFVAASNGLTVFINKGSNDSSVVDGNSTLWVTNGSLGGTQQINNAALGANILSGVDTVSIGGRAIFAAIDSAGEYSVWSTDGTSAGTIKIFVDGVAIDMTRPVLSLAAWGNRLIIETGYGLTVTNNLGAGTENISPWATMYPGEAVEPPGYAILGNKLILVSPGATVYNPSEPDLLYVSDGTEAGSARLDVPGLLSVTGNTMTVVGNQVVFQGTDSSGKQALFASDGTSAGSHELALPANVSLDPNNPSVIEALSAPVVTPPPTVTLGGGNQTYNAAAGTTVQAGSGSDTITASAGNVTVAGSSGQLTFFGGTAASSASGGTGSATIFGGTGGGVYAGGGAGHNVLVSQGSAGVSTQMTGAGPGDQLFGSAAGNDVLTGGSGRDSMLGGGGFTTINGGSTASVIFSGGGPTTVNGGTGGQDTIVGGSAALAVTAQNGDAVFGNAGALSVTASLEGADSIVGGAGALSIAGRGGNMLVVAGTSTSNVSTGNGASLVFAGSGNLSLVGGTGSMQVVAGSGHATIIEGAGPTTLQVVNGAAGGSDVVSGFRPGLDTVELFGYSTSGTVSTVGGSTLISLADGTRVTLLGVSNPGHSIIG